MMEKWIGEMKEVEAVRRRFGDEQSTLLDRFERHSFEVQLKRAMLGRSLSDPTTTLPRTTYAPAPPPAPPLISMVKQGRRFRGLSFQKVLKKLLKPIMGRGNKGTASTEVPGPKSFSSWKTFSRSLRG